MILIRFKRLTGNTVIERCLTTFLPDFSNKTNLSLSYVTKTQTADNQCRFCYLYTGYSSLLGDLVEICPSMIFPYFIWMELFILSAILAIPPLWSLLGLNDNILIIAGR
jgi:hypothetical protein